MGGGGGGGSDRNSRNDLTLSHYPVGNVPYFPGAPGLQSTDYSPGSDAGMTPMVGAAPGNIADRSAGSYNLGMGGYGGMLGHGGNLLGQNAPGSDMSQYMNPYTQNVIDTTFNDMQRQRNWLENQREDEFLRYGSSYGGSRHGIRDVLDDEAFYKASGEVAAPLHQANFQNAQNQQQFFNNLGAQLASGGAGGLSNLANMGFGFSRNIAQDQMMQGALQRQLQQQLMDSLRSQWEQYQGIPERNLGYSSQIPQFPQNAGTTTTTQPTPSLMSGLMPLLGMMLSPIG